MEEEIKRLYDVLNPGIFIFVEDEIEFDGVKGHVMIDYSRMNSDDRQELLDSLPDSPEKTALVNYTDNLSSWINSVDWSQAASDDIEFSIKSFPEAKDLYDMIDSSLWEGDNSQLFLRYGVGAKVPELFSQFLSITGRNNTNAIYAPIRMYQNYVEEVHQQIIRDFNLHAKAGQSAIVILDNVVGGERLAKSMIDDLNKYINDHKNRVFATIFSSSAGQNGETSSTEMLYVGYAQKSNGLEDVHSNIVLAAMNVLIQSYREKYKGVIHDKCKVLCENPALVNYLYGMTQAEGAAGYETFHQWLSFMTESEMEKSVEFKTIIKLSNSIESCTLKKNLNLDLPPELIKAASSENFSQSVNEFCSMISPGDIFEYEDKLYVLVGQDCDYMMGEHRKRRVPFCDLLSAELVSQKDCDKLDDDKRYVYVNNYLNSDGRTYTLKIDYSHRNFISNEILNLCAFNINGSSCLDYNKPLCDEVKAIIQPYMLKYYDNLVSYFKSLIKINTDHPKFFECQEKLQTALPLLSIYCYNQEDEKIQYPIRRVARLKSTASLLVNKMFLEYRGRLPYTSINLIGYSIICANIVYNGQPQQIEVYMKLSNNRNSNSRKASAKLPWLIKKGDLAKIFPEFSKSTEEYIELKGGTECKLPYSGGFARFKKSVSDENCLITVEIT